jgi:hypothetical protein
MRAALRRAINRLIQPEKVEAVLFRELVIR